MVAEITGSTQTRGHLSAEQGSNETYGCIRNTAVMSSLRLEWVDASLLQFIHKNPKMSGKSSPPSWGCSVGILLQRYCRSLIASSERKRANPIMGRASR